MLEPTFRPLPLQMNDARPNISPLPLQINAARAASHLPRSRQAKRPIPSRRALPRRRILNPVAPLHRRFLSPSPLLPATLFANFAAKPQTHSPADTSPIIRYPTITPARKPSNKGSPLPFFAFGVPFRIARLARSSRSAGRPAVAICARIFRTTLAQRATLLYAAHPGVANRRPPPRPFISLLPLQINNARAASHFPRSRQAKRPVPSRRRPSKAAPPLPPFCFAAAAITLACAPRPQN
jgi:hypothetical protein